jgi:hypothetical protein
VSLAALAILGLIAAFLAFIAFGSPSRYDDDPAIVLAINLVWSLPWAGLMVLGGWKLRNLELYGLAVTAAVAAVLPIHLLAILTLPVGVWALALLLRRDVRAAFARASSRETSFVAFTESAPPPRKPDRPDEEVRAKLTLPALGLVLAGIVDALIAAGLAGGVAMGIDMDIPDPAGFAMLFSSLAMGLVFIGAGTRMLHFRSYRLALFASLLAIAPTSPAWPISLPCGIYSLARLASRKIRREFEIEKQSLAA